MSLKNLKEAVLSIAEEMTQEANDLKESGKDPVHDYLHDCLKGYARALRVMAKAAGDDPQPVQAQVLNPLLTPSMQHIQEIEKARNEFKKPQRDMVAVEERYEGGDMVEVVGGPAAPESEGFVYENVDPQMPLGAYTHKAGAVYRLEKQEGKRRLVYDEAQTLRVKQQQEQQ